MGIKIIVEDTVICEECGHVMCVDDVDYKFNGRYNVYYVCTHCNTSCTREVRFGQKFKENWYTENNETVREWEHKYMN